MTVKDIYVAVGKTQGINEQEMEGILQKACLRAPLNLATEVPPEHRAAAINMLLDMFALYQSLSVKQKKDLVSGIEEGLAHRN